MSGKERLSMLDALVRAMPQGAVVDFASGVGGGRLYVKDASGAHRLVADTYDHASRMAALAWFSLAPLIVSELRAGRNLAEVDGVTEEFIEASNALDAAIGQLRTT